VTQPEHQVCLLLGSNIQPEKNLALGMDLLRQKVKIVRSSSVWESPPVGSFGPDFLNVAVMVITPLEAVDLKEKVLRPLEGQLGRVRSQDKNAPRTIDLDILLFDGQLVDPSLFLYAHRAVPVAELLPELPSPQGRKLADIASELAKNTPIRLKPIVLIDN
jgi:2-amino-4-hydroxy-6-hydroxymethyldihydropteridine diphosphokinase